MRTRAAILTGTHRDWEVVDLELSDPGPTEVLVRMEVAGLCHSDKHMRFGFAPYPFVGGPKVRVRQSLDLWNRPLVDAV